MIVGYARVSTTDQNLDLQRDALKRAGCEKIIEDTVSGGKLEGSAPRLPEGVGAVQATAAGARVLASRFRKILVNCKKHQPKPGGARQIVIHDRVLLGLVTSGV